MIESTVKNVLTRMTLDMQLVQVLTCTIHPLDPLKVISFLLMLSWTWLLQLQILSHKIKNGFHSTKKPVIYDMFNLEGRKNLSMYVDPEPTFVFNPTKLDIPKTVQPIDRVLIQSKLNNVLYKEKKAIQQAVSYSDKCTKLEQRCRDLETEKEAVRYFWRNKVFEGKSRAARMLKESLGT